MNVVLNVQGLINLNKELFDGFDTYNLRRAELHLGLIGQVNETFCKVLCIDFPKDLVYPFRSLLQTYKCL